MASAEGAPVVTHVLRDAGNFTFRVWFGENVQQGAAKALMKELERFECWSDVYSEKYLAMSCGTDKADDLANYLRAREDQGDLQYETGRMRTG